MKATGIVRRIDDLGRVVIPKEIRRTMRIREGDPLEIYTSANGEVVFKKYSPIGELGPYTKQYVEVLNRTTGLPAVICDRDRIVAVAGVPKKDVLEKRISPIAESYMERRTNYIRSENNEEFTLCDGVTRKVSVLCPVVGGGDVMGAVVVLEGGGDAPAGTTEIKLVQVAAGFLGKQMEE